MKNIRDYNCRQILEKQVFESYEEMKLFSLYRQNILVWYPFLKETEILHIGSGAGILTSYLCSIGNVISVEENPELRRIQEKVLPKIKICSTLKNPLIQNKKFDYIIIEGYLDNHKNKEQILKFLLSCLQKNGKLFILTNNKLALRYFSGIKEEISNKYFGNLSEYTNLLTRKEWCSLLDKFNLNYNFFYPYPNYSFPEYIFSKAPEGLEVAKDNSPYLSPKIDLFDTFEAFKSIKDSGYFEDFSNSFLIIINDQSNVVYSKISRERKDEFQIFTNIIDNKGKIKVEKKPILYFGIEHLEKIYEYYLMVEQFNNNNQVRCCKVEKKEDFLSFEYISGISLESLVHRASQDDRLDLIEKYLNIVKEIACIGEKDVFEESEGLIEVFGNHDYSLLNNMLSTKFTNIDLIFENIIVNDKYNVIDYEWVFKFKIPPEFVIYRTILHSPSLNRLPTKSIFNLYDKFGINAELRDLFYKMELCFQHYVSANKIENDKRMFNSTNVGIESLYQGDKIFKIQCDKKESIKVIYDRNFCFDEIISAGQIDFTLNKKAILKLDSISIDNVPIQDLKTNSVLNIGNDYYFLEMPRFTFQCKKNGLLHLSGFIYYFNDDLIDYIVYLTKEIEELNNQLVKLRSNKLIRLIEKLGGK